MEDKYKGVFPKPILSICIPTYNRSEYLERALEAYVSNISFDNSVEIVISDNASTDDTFLVAEKYSKRYPNIKYYRNETNVKDVNFVLALDRASGLYAKLMNDNAIITHSGLSYIKEEILQHIEDRTPMFFTNGILFNHKKVDSLLCESFDDFIVSLSFYVTAIMTFGCWKNDWALVSDKMRYSHLQLSQDDWTYQIVEHYQKAILCTNNYCNSLDLTSKQRKGYNWFEVHVSNYYKILQPYIDKGLLSKSAIRKERRTYLIGLRSQIIYKYLYNLPKWQFDMSGASHILWRYFKKEPLFYMMMATLPIWGSLLIIKSIIQERCR